MGKRLVGLLMAFVLTVTGICGCGLEEKKAGDFAHIDKVDDEYRNYYEIFVGSFYDSNRDGTGDLRGIMEKLDYIEEMGFNGIWLTPIMPSPSYHKYDVTDYYDIDPGFGTLADYQALLEACHERKITLIIDMVFNHTSSEHPWFLEACEYLKGLKAGENPDAEACPYVEYYHFAREGQQEVNWHRIDGSDWYYEGVFWEGMPDLALENEAVREEIEKIADFWLELGTDGFRLDAAKEYFTGYAEKNTEVLSWFTDYVKGKNPGAYLVAEVWEGQAAIQEYYRSRIDSLFNFPAAAQDGAIVRTAKKRNSPAEFFEWVIRHRSADLEANPSYIDAPFISNHDTTRISAQCVNDEKAMKFAAGLLFMLPGSPFVYYGEEIGMKSQGTKDENKRLPMYWSAADATGMPDPPAEADSVEQKFPALDEQLEDPLSIAGYYRAALRIRNLCPELARGEIEMAQGQLPEGVAIVLRNWKEEKCAVVLSTSEGIAEIGLKEYGLDGYELKESLEVDEQRTSLEDGVLKLPEYGIAILKPAA